MIVAPKVIRPGRPYAVSVNLMDVPGKGIVELQIKNSKNESIDRVFVRDAEPGMHSVFSVYILFKIINKFSLEKLKF